MKVNFLPTSSIQNQEKRFMRIENMITKGEKLWSFMTKRKTINLFFKELYGDQSGEFEYEYWDLRVTKNTSQVMWQSWYLFVKSGM